MLWCGARWGGGGLRPWRGGGRWGFAGAVGAERASSGAGWGLDCPGCAAGWADRAARAEA